LRGFKGGATIIIFRTGVSFKTPNIFLSNAVAIGIIDTSAKFIFNETTLGIITDRKTTITVGNFKKRAIGRGLAAMAGNL